MGQVEVGKMKFRGATCPSPEDAKQSAAAVANSNWQVGLLLRGDSRLASSHFEIYVSLFQPATVVSKNFTSYM